MISGDVEVEEIQIDHLSMSLACEPEAFDVLLLPNLYGDILSDLCAGLVGGLGLIPGANIGWEYAVFEPVHGSAPGHRRKGPGEPDRDDPVRRDDAAPPAANRRPPPPWSGRSMPCCEQGDVRTPDLGGTSSTHEVGLAIAAGRVELVPVRVVVPLGTSTEVLREASTARLTVVPAALPRREERPKPVAERQPSFVRNGASYSRQFVKKSRPRSFAIAQKPSSRTSSCYGGLVRRRCFTRGTWDATLARCSPSRNPARSACGDSCSPCSEERRSRSGRSATGRRSASGTAP